MATINVQDIQQHAEVVGSDHQHVGTVDHLDGQDKIKLAKNDQSANGQHHYIPTQWVQQIQGNQVVLNKTADQVFQQWQ
ncbi:MAG TPA: DUF2171 domain-containing protein [Acinetobacter ursingii]|uniref:DUF2171 domain-containing protein n=4 Tax=Acinetobacter TaxID=469 RepID=N9DCR8_9GAMM|nr:MULTISPECIES: DUF2171 domain-containing protein [Acinetobacter]ECE6726078.1 DUF2171 domain-containing protein [Salmonella enterica subsp. enterica serovar Paratyphi A]MDU3123989.1 DUF2171 domain-containing protein [Acinetobacter baumannii]MEC8057232.1 DUF2171 domain-containing protein [Pseudomonadota bacterium]NOZ97926.1 DUF2171 domain-containing protein [Gammaproteobacteria bacterium]ENV74466.1 hypothetical protein F944_03317 [Acinetobacter ursingii DSM 16037 = CIP 107286]